MIGGGGGGGGIRRYLSTKEQYTVDGISGTSVNRVLRDTALTEILGRTHHKEFNKIV